MSRRFPIIAVTGSSGAGTSTVREAFEHMFRRESITATIVEGDGFHRYTRAEMRLRIREADAAGKRISHFGPHGNLWPELEALFSDYAKEGKGRYRRYLHNEREARPFADAGLKAGDFSPWVDVAPDTEVLLYEGLHGCLRTDGLDFTQYVDLKVGVAPVINLEWIQKIHRDTCIRGYSEEAVVDTILRRMDDYVRYVVPQFELTDINFQRVPVVDTSNPLIARDIPDTDETLTVIRFRQPDLIRVDFPYLLQMLQGSWMTRRNTIVVPGGKTRLAMELIITPILRRVMADRYCLIH
ncbi:phosphoribulokinase [Oleispirillum naphthae]|uniref:phosphoribulokinase n=1 Tax=Oleispirillum naphthae TaxID=2838853 RepID=UPI0030823A4F